jgi:hypothetical protein
MAWSVGSKLAWSTLLSIVGSLALLGLARVLYSGYYYRSTVRKAAREHNIVRLSR